MFAAKKIENLILLNPKPAFYSKQNLIKNFSVFNIIFSFIIYVVFGVQTPGYKKLTLDIAYVQSLKKFLTVFF